MAHLGRFFSWPKEPDDCPKENFDMEKRLLGIEELGEYIGIRPQTIRNRLSQGTFPIPAKKICGRVKFERADVEKYLEKLKPRYRAGVDTEHQFWNTVS
jgi:predicted DNA-binding transcriptional regulator AlpA